MCRLHFVQAGVWTDVGGDSHAPCNRALREWQRIKFIMWSRQFQEVHSVGRFESQIKVVLLLTTLLFPSWRFASRDESWIVFNSCKVGGQNLKTLIAQRMTMSDIQFLIYLLILSKIYWLFSILLLRKKKEKWFISYTHNWNDIYYGAIPISNGQG